MDSGDPTRSRCSELIEAWQAFELGEFDQAQSLAERHSDSASEQLARESRKLVALSLFGRRDFHGALLFFSELARSSSESTDWFNLATSAALAGETGLAEEAFENALRCWDETENNQGIGPAYMYLYFACALRDSGKFDEACDKLDALRSTYEELYVTDTTFLYIRGVPFLSHFMDVARSILTALGDEVDARGWIEAFASKLDDDGREYVLSLVDGSD